MRDSLFPLELSSITQRYENFNLSTQNLPKPISTPHQTEVLSSVNFPLSDNVNIPESAPESHPGCALPSPIFPLKLKKECTSYFQLLHQPNEKQRKSYKNENRYILPNPLTVCLTRQVGENLPDIKQGTVTVQLLYDTGEELEDDKKDILSGVKTRALDVEKKAQFHLKVVETSERNKFRLQFTVRFFIDKIPYEEKIISHCFRVTSNKKTIHIEPPRPFALKPSEGYAHSETEIWIRGKSFTDRANTSVRFGGKEARVIETEDTMLVCYAPPRDDLTEDTQVKLEITNFHPEMGSLSATKSLNFTYIVDRRKKLKRERQTTFEEQRHSPELMKDDTNLFCPPSPGTSFPCPRLEDILRSENEVSRLMSFFTSESH